VAGLVIGDSSTSPMLGEAVETLGWRFEAIDMDGRRIDKVLAQRITNTAAPMSEAVSIP
jgi:putative hemolysin